MNIKNIGKWQATAMAMLIDTWESCSGDRWTGVDEVTLARAMDSLVERGAAISIEVPLPWADGSYAVYKPSPELIEAWPSIEGRVLRRAECEN